MILEAVDVCFCAMPGLHERMTLFITGGLAPKAMERQLRREAEPLVVLEHDTLLERGRYPQVGEWLTLSDLAGFRDIEALRAQVALMFSEYLRQRPELGDQPGDSELRKAFVRGAFLEGCFTRVYHMRLRELLWARHRFDRLVVAPGSGVNFAFWRAVAAEEGMEIIVLEPEWKGRGLRRKIERWLCKRAQKKARSSIQPSLQPSIFEGAPDDTGLPLAVCASRRVAPLLAQEKEPCGFRVIQAGMKDLDPPDPAFEAAERERFSTWWRRWKTEVLPASCAPDAKPCLAPLRDLFERMGEEETAGTYPRVSALRARARAWLESRAPAAVIADMQMNEDEAVWSLAAAQAGIPVIAYSYDCLALPDITHSPDILLMDGVRGRSRTLRAGYPAERMIDVRCHRIPAAPPRTAAEIDAAFTARRPLVLSADTMAVINDPQEGLRGYRLLVEAARRLPEMDFVVKFHPLRTPKSEERSFLGMDENEIQVKTRFIRALRPPRNFRLAPPEASMQDWLEKASVLVNTISLTGQEAFHFGIPVVFLCRLDADFITFPDMEKWMTPLLAENADRLVDALRRLATDADFRHAQARQQHHYQDQCFWPAGTSLAAGIRQAARLAAELGPFPR
ncbi:MAG TPA: hypothetical protein DIT64_00740 [Verrucomicrobiales bacterium]|nr:hypothetical protein [Verrucomicrobiales bacterium]